MFTFIALPVVSLPFVPHAFCVVIHTLAPEQMGIEPGISLFFVVQAREHKVQFCFGQRYSLFEKRAFRLAAELDNLALRMCAVRFAACADRTGNRALSVGFATARRTIPLVAAVEGRASKE